VRCLQTVEPLAASSSSSCGSVHGGLSEGAFGERLKNAKTLVVDAAGRPVRRFRV